MPGSILPIDEYVESKDLFYDFHLIQGAVVRNLQVMAQSSQWLSDEIKSMYCR